MAYKLHFADRSLSSDDIIAQLEPGVPLQRAYINYVKAFEANGMRYSNEDFDVLSSAYRAIGKTEVPSYEAGFVGHWA